MNTALMSHVRDCVATQLDNFTNRYGIVLRKVTHRHKQLKLSHAAMQQAVQGWLLELRGATQLLPAQLIYQMDETPIYFDLNSEKTLEFRGKDCFCISNCIAFAQYTSEHVCMRDAL